MRNAEFRVSNGINEFGQWPILRVVRAIVLSSDEQSFFTVYRNGRHFPGKGEDPGGKVDSGNSLHKQLSLELFQELGLSPHQYGILPVEPLINFMMFDPRHPDSLDTPYARKLIYTTTFVARLKPGVTPQISDEHQGWAWQPICDWQQENLTPYTVANRLNYQNQNGRISYSAQAGNEGKMLSSPTYINFSHANGNHGAKR